MQIIMILTETGYQKEHPQSSESSKKDELGWKDIGKPTAEQQKASEGQSIGDDAIKDRLGLASEHPIGSKGIRRRYSHPSDVTGCQVEIRSDLRSHDEEGTDIQYVDSRRQGEDGEEDGLSG